MNKDEIRKEIVANRHGSAMNCHTGCMVNNIITYDYQPNDWTMKNYINLNFNKLNFVHFILT